MNVIEHHFHFLITDGIGIGTGGGGGGGGAKGTVAPPKYLMDNDITPKGTCTRNTESIPPPLLSQGKD